MEVITSNEEQMEPFHLYNKDKWLPFINDRKYQDVRNKIRNTFNELVFDEGPHKYYLHEKEITCVSNVAHLYQEHFNKEEKAKETSERNFKNPDSKYYQMTPEEILKEWDSISKFSTTHGTERHEFGESCFYFMCGRYDEILDGYKDRLHKDDNGDYYFEAKYAKEIAVAKFWTDLPKSVVPILAETKVYDESLFYAGTFDILFMYDATLDNKPEENSGLWIFDYKSNKDLYKNFMGKTLLEPFDNQLDMPLSTYKIQLSLYQNPLENIGFKVIARTIIWMKPDGNYDKIRLENFVNVLRKDLNERIEKHGCLR